MKKIALAAAIAATGTAAMAGGLAEPIIEAPIIEETAASSSAAGIVVPLLLLAIVAAAAAND